MRRSHVRYALLLAVLLPVCALAASPLAPGDEYFGRMKMSGLGIRVALFRLRIAAYHHDLAPGALLDRTLLVDDAFFDWAKKYPRDSWLAQTAWGLELLYRMIPGPNAHTHAVAVLHYLADNWATTKYAHDARLALKNGLPPQPAPWTVAVATPQPTASAASVLCASPTPAASPEPSETASETPSAAASEAASPAAEPSAPACPSPGAAPATPAPTPAAATPVPSAMPTAEPSASAAPSAAPSPASS